ncbi:MAG: hypothetical protein ACRDRG_08495 [Pseudonocardiaceae bacterium]
MISTLADRVALAVFTLRGGIQEHDFIMGGDTALCRHCLTVVDVAPYNAEGDWVASTVFCPRKSTGVIATISGRITGGSRRSNRAKERTMITRTLAVLALALAALTACGTVGAQQSSMTAEQIVTELAQRVPTAKPGIVITAESDPNKLLGRPNGYVSKASFTDSRVNPEDIIDTWEGAVDPGGSVEVFTDEQAAQNRLKFIQAVTAGIPAFTEYGYVSGATLVRVSKSLTPEQAAEYERVLAEIN